MCAWFVEKASISRLNMQNYDQKRQKYNYANKCERLIFKTCNPNLEIKSKLNF